MNIKTLKDLISQEKALLLYFTTTDCNVCKSLKPKLLQMVETQFPNFTFLEIDSAKNQEISAKLSIFSVPTILIFFQGAEHYRKSRYINTKEFAKELQRPYKIFFQ